MNLKCRINGIDYENVSQGESFADEFNETLDSGTLIISHQSFLENLKPYDDVYVWDSEYNFIGFDRDELYMKKDNVDYTFVYNWENWEFENKYNRDQKIFFKHLLVDNFSETMINIRDVENKNKGVGNYTPIYEYKIQLMSETKGLEVVQLPNVSITEPLNQLYKLTVWQYLEKYINLYSPVYKKVANETQKTWEFEKKYSLSETLKTIFENVYSPDFTLNNPNLKDVISKLMITKDLIPFVKNNVIYGMDITKRGKSFKIDEHVNYVSGSMTSQDYCDNLKKTYSDALSKNNTARSIEYIGFRNDENALMTLDNMRLETRFPIYRINKIYMCYYKKVIIPTEIGKDNIEKIFLCKQDITPLVKLNTERNVLIQDWEELQGKDSMSPEEMAKYKMLTVGYDIGSKYITGWGTKYTYPIAGTFWDITKTYIQNIFEKMDLWRPYGIYGVGYAKKLIGYSGNYIFDTVNPLNNIAGNIYGATNDALKLKTFIFEIDYQAFYSGTVIHTKDNGRDNITINDNPSSSLTLLEQDGLYTKEKANRFGNKAITINARYDNIWQMQPLGSVFHDYETGDDDIIIYHREYQIWNNYVQVTYYGIHDYVLKNYYTSVYARHRTWNLMPYSESVRRAENKKMMLLLSKDYAYYEDFHDNDIENHKFLIKDINNNEDIYEILFSSFKSNELPETMNLIEKPHKLNYAYIKYSPLDINTGEILKDDNNNEISEYYLSDLNGFVSGNSLCLNVCMPDNISGGNYISKFRPNFNNYNDKSTKPVIEDILNYFLYTNVENDYTGSIQSWKKVTDDFGYARRMGFYLAHSDTNYDDTIYNNDSDVDNIYLNDFFNFPYISDINKYTLTNKIGNDFDIYKDNKEIIDMTYQIEPISYNKDVMFSPWFMQLNDLITSYNKFNGDENYKENQKLEASFQIYCGSYNYYSSTSNKFDEESKRRPYFVFKISKSLFNAMAYACEKTGAPMGINDSEVNYKIYNTLNESDYPQCISSYSIDFHSIVCEWNNDKPQIKLNILENMYITPAIDKTIKHGRIITLSNTESFTLSTEIGDSNFIDTPTYYYFIFNEYKMKYPNGNDINYKSFVGQIDWSNDPESPFYSSSTASNYDINSLYSNSDNANELLTKKCYYLPVNAVSQEYGNDYTKYFRNMFVLTSENTLDKEIVYDKYGYANEYDNEYSTYNLNEVVSYNESIWININPVLKPENFDESKWRKISKAVVNGNLYKITDDKTFWSNINLKVTDKYVENVFSIQKDTNQRAYIKVDLSLFNEKPESIQYWYVDSGTINFVFGVNVNDSEWDKKEIKIYISTLTTRDTRVYDAKGMLKGNILNLAKEDAPFYANFFQYYDIPEIAPMYSIKFVGDTSNYTYEIERISSEMGAENKIIDISKDIIYYKDKLKISFSKERAYEFEHIMINGKTFENYSTIEVVEDLNIDVKSVLKTFDVSVTIDEGGTLTLNRVSSSYANAPLGVVSTSDTFYYGDYLKVQIELEENYRLIEFTVNGTVKPEYEQILVIEDIDIVAKLESPGPKTVWEGNVAYDFLENNGLEEETILDMRELLDYDITFNMHSRVRITFSELQISYTERADTVPDGNFVRGVYRNETMIDGQNNYASDYAEFEEFGEAYLYFERYWEQGYASEEPTRYLKFRRNYVQESEDFKYIYSRVVITKIELIY